MHKGKGGFPPFSTFLYLYFIKNATMSDDYTGEDHFGPEYDSDPERMTGLERKKLSKFLTRNSRSIPTNSPEINISISDQAQMITPSTSILEGMILDWQTESPISPVSPDNATSEDQLYGTMLLISEVRKNVGRNVTEIEDAKSVRNIFTEIRRTTGVHQKDVFDEEWKDFQHITESYPYASMKFSFNMTNGLDGSGRLVTYTHDDMTVLADENSLFWYENGILLYASNSDVEGNDLIDVFLFSDESKIHKTQFHNFNESFYKSLRSEGRDHSVDPIMKHLRSLYLDNDKQSVKDIIMNNFPKLSTNINYTPIGIDDYTERLMTNRLICEKVDEFSKKHRENLITDKTLETFIERSIGDIHKERSKLMDRGTKPLGLN